MHEGHRKRMLSRAESDVAGMNDHELLEIVLFRTIPRQNTNPLAHELISAFGSLEGVFRASFEQLLAVKGVGETTAAYIQTIGEIIRRLPVRNAKVAEPELFNVQTFVDYLRANFVHENVEYVELYCLDSKHRIRFKKRYTSDDVSHVAVSSEEISRTVIAQKAYGLVVVHNHPSAPPYPSADDHCFTKKIGMLCALSGILFCDHIILGSGGEIYSYYLDGKMDDIRSDAARMAGGTVQ